MVGVRSIRDWMGPLSRMCEVLLITGSDCPFDVLAENILAVVWRTVALIHLVLPSSALVFAISF